VSRAAVWAGVVAVVGMWLVACASAPRAPAHLRDYEVLVPERDTLSRALATEFERAGLQVRRDPRGGAKAPAVLVHYEFREPGAAGRRWLYARLFHARSSAVLAAARLPADGLPPEGLARARLLVAALLTPPDTVLLIDEPGR
jgi:hypothetical protein